MCQVSVVVPLLAVLYLLPVQATEATPAPSLVIRCDPGRFVSVAAAANAEQEVDWNDADQEDDRACTESFAATELQRFLIQAGWSVSTKSLLRANWRVVGSPAQIVLTSDEQLPHDVDTSSVPALGRSEQAFRVIPLSGTSRSFIIQGRGRIGTLYGVYSFLEGCGYRFYGLGATGIVAPRMRPARLPDEAWASEPAFELRGFWAWEPRGNPDFFDWMGRNKMNLWTCEERERGQLHKRGIKLTAGGHAIQKECLDPDAEYPYAVPGDPRGATLPPEPYRPSEYSRGDQNGDGRLTYFEAHPEWYALLDGQRSGRIGVDAGDNFCTSNADAVHELAKNLSRKLETGSWRDATVLMFWMLDNGRWCTCAKCRQIGPPTERILTLADSVAVALMLERDAGRLNRRVVVSPLAFLETMAPPIHEHPAAAVRQDVSITWFPIDRCYAHPIADPQCREINEAYAAELLEWTSGAMRWHGGLAVGEYYNVDQLKCLPVVLTHVIAHDVAWYYAHGVRTFHYMHVPTRDWGPLTLNHVLLARLLWDPREPPGRVCDEYFDGYYPHTTYNVRMAYALLERGTASLKLLKHRVRVGGAIYQCRKQLSGGRSPFVLEHLTPDTLRIMSSALSRASRCLEVALKEAGRGAERARVEEDVRRVEYCRLMVDFYRAIIEVVESSASDPSMMAQLKEAAERLREMKNVATTAGLHANADNGLSATGLEDLYRQLSHDN